MGKQSRRMRVRLGSEGNSLAADCTTGLRRGAVSNREEGAQAAQELKGKREREYRNSFRFTLILLARLLPRRFPLIGKAFGGEFARELSVSQRAIDDD